MLRLALACCILLCLSIAGYGGHLILEQQERVLAYSARTTATVLEKRLQIDDRYRYHRGGEFASFIVTPVVRFRFQAQGREFTNDNVFPHTFKVGGSLGHTEGQAALERFEVGQETAAYYNPDNPAEACLIRRPPIFLYGVVLLPIIVVCGFAYFLWPQSRPGDAESQRRRARWIAALWHLVGLASGGQYFSLAGADYGGGALAVFGLYTQLGLIPVACALPPSQSSAWAKRIKDAIGFSLFGTFVGLGLGYLLGWLAVNLFSAGSTVFQRCWGYTMVICTIVFAVLSQFGREK